MIFSGELRQAIACHYGSNNGCYGKSDSLAGTKKPCGAFCNAYEKLLLLRIHFLNVIVHNRSELHWCLDVWNWRVGSAGTFNYDRPIIKDSS